MQQISRLIKYILFFIILIFNGNLLANDTFEDAGIVENINKTSKTISLNGIRMLIDGEVKVEMDNTQHHLLNVLLEGSTIGVEGIKDASGNYIIKSAFIYHLPGEEF